MGDDAVKKLEGKLSPTKPEGLIGQIRALPYQAHVLSVTTVTVSEDGEFIFTTGDDNTAKRWNVNTGQVVNNYLGHSDSVWCLGLIGETQIVTGSRDALAKRWDVETGECLMDYAGHEGEDPGVRCLAVVPGCETFFTGSRDFTARHWNTETGQCLGVIKAHEGIIWNMCTSFCGKYLFTAGADNVVKQWNVGSYGGDAPVAKFEHPDFVWSVAINNDGTKIFTGCRDKKARRWDVASRKCDLEFIGHTDTVRWVALHATKNHLLTAGYDVRVKEWDAETGCQLQDITAHQKAVLCVTSSKKDGNIFSSSADALIMRFNSSSPGEGSSTAMVAAAADSQDLEDVQGKTSPKVTLTEEALITYQNISTLKVGMVILAIFVQALQLASFAFNVKFPWDAGLLGWLKDALGVLNVSLEYITQRLPDLTISVRGFEVTILAWALFAIFLFGADVFGMLQDLKVWLNAKGWGKVKKSRYKGDNPLEVGDRTATNKAEWQVWETTTWTYWSVEMFAKLVWIILWLASTLFAIPTIGVLVETLARTEVSTGRKVVTGITLVFYILMTLRLRVSNGNASAISFVRRQYASQNRERFIVGSWMFTVGGMAALEPLGPMTTQDWQADLGQTGVAIGFSVVNSTPVALIVVATLNIVFAIMLVANLIKNRSFYELQSSRALFGLQCLQLWNNIIALVIVGINDEKNAQAASIVWLVGFVFAFLFGYWIYPKIHEYSHSKKNN